MKILALVTDGFGGYGGIAQYNRDFTTALASLEAVESVLLLPRSGAPLESAVLGTKLRQEQPVAGRLRYSLRALIAARRYVPDVIFCGHLFMAPLAWLLARILRKPWWLQIHGIEAWDRPGTSQTTAKDLFPRWFPIWTIAENADLITAVSRYTRRRFLSWANADRARVKVLPNTYDVRATSSVTKAQLKEHYGLSGRKVLLTVSRIDRGDRYKGHDKVLAIMPELVGADPTLTYLIVGDGDNRPELQRLAREHGLESNVRFVGRISEDELHDHYGMADVFVMPSAKEGFGIVFLEAALHGLPVVAGNMDGSTDACADGAIGTCVDPRNDEDLVSAIQRALKGGMHTGGIVQERFGPQQYRKLVSRLLAELCAPVAAR
jgi:phosphatidyl-myo-inositol dimannoside synthase